MTGSRILLSCLAAIVLCTTCPGAAPRQTKLVLFITADGVRWQDVYRGAEEAFLNKAVGGIKGTENEIRRKWWRPDPKVRRSLLMPFLWDTIATKGQLWGNRDIGSECDVLNDRNFSYPGYNEFLCGHVDPRIRSNNPVPNENVSVLEWLNGRDSARGRVGAINSWTTLPAILNAGRSLIPMWTAGSPAPAAWDSPTVRLINDLTAQTVVPWNEGTCDSFVFGIARDVLPRIKPRVMYINFAEPDEWAHAVRYDRYLDSLHKFDGYLRQLWELTQADPEFRGATSLVITTDHGRGTEPATWTSHGENIEHSGQTWFAVLSPDAEPLGERGNVPAQKTAGAAATVAALLGEDWPAAEPRAAAPWPVLKD